MTTLAGILASFLLCALLTQVLIWLLQKYSAYQIVRKEGPQEHRMTKHHIPTMGGIALLLAVFLMALPLAQHGSLWILLGTFLACGFLGFLDDGLKVFFGRNLGLKARHKLLGQIMIGVGLWLALEKTGDAYSFHIPFGGDWNPGKLFPFLVIFALMATTNAVNLTDGLDGLAGGVSAIAVGFFLLASFVLNVNPLVTYFSAALLGATLGFLWFNVYPAKIFMGDSGSLALGGALCVLAFQTKLLFWLPIVGGIFVIETLSVILQVIYFKLTGGGRIFKMSPLHHHFELSGVPENQVTLRFWLISLFLAWFSLLGVVHRF